MIFQRIFKPIEFIIHHPITQKHKLRGIGRFLFWQFYSRFIRNELVINWIGTSKLYLKKGLHGATGNYYCYLHDFEEMSFLLHFLRPADVFWDIGANIGSYSILAAKNCHAKIFAFEPIPQTFKVFQKNIEINDIEKNIIPNNIGLSDKKGHLYFTYQHDSMNHVAHQNENSIKVPVKTVDEIINLVPEIPIMIKIDVEGYELPVFRGGSHLLKNNRLKVIVVELNGLGEKYGFSDQMVDQLLRNSGFNIFKYKPFERKLNEYQNLDQSQNYIYIRDIDFVYDRIKNGDLIRIGKLSY